MQAIPTSLQFSPFKRSSRQWMVPKSPSLFGKSHLKANKKCGDSLHVRRQDLKVFDSKNPLKRLRYHGILSYIFYSFL